MNNISIYMKRLFVFQKILRIVQISSLFFVFAFLLSDNEIESQNTSEDSFRIEHLHHAKAVQIDDVDKKLSGKARNISLFGIVIMSIFCVASGILELSCIRCPKCRSYIRLKSPNFCSKCGLKFNNNDM